MWGLNEIMTNSIIYGLGEEEAKNKSLWHTGRIPTEEGCFYALQCKGHRHPEPYFGVVVDGVFSAINWNGDLMPLPPDLIAWQKIEPYKEKDDGHEI